MKIIVLTIFAMASFPHGVNAPELTLKLGGCTFQLSGDDQSFNITASSPECAARVRVKPEPKP